MERRTLASATLCLALCLVATAASAKNDKSDGKSIVWSVSEDGEPVGRETLKIVRSESKTLFATAVYAPASKKGIKLVSHIQRGADGILAKYRRTQDVRKGQGVFAFRRGDKVRVVGINTNAQPVELQAAISYVVLDPTVVTAFWEWSGKLKSAAGPINLSFIDVKARTTGTVSLTPSEPRPVYDPETAPHEVIPWTAAGLPMAATLYVSKKLGLVGLEVGNRSYLLAKWSWEAPIVEEPDGESGEGGDSDGGSSDSSEAPGVGP